MLIIQKSGNPRKINKKHHVLAAIQQSNNRHSAFKNAQILYQMVETEGRT